MASIKTCDVCGESPAQPVEIGVVLWGVVLPDQPTATSEVLDACPGCQEAAIDALVAHGKATLREQAPLQVEMLKHAAERDAAQEEFNCEVKPILEMLAAAGAKEVPKDVAAKRDEFLKRVEDAEAARVAVFVEAKALHDARVQAMRQTAKRA